MFEFAGCGGKKKLEQKNNPSRLYIPHAHTVNHETEHLASFSVQQQHVLLPLTTRSETMLKVSAVQRDQGTNSRYYVDDIHSAFRFDFLQTLINFKIISVSIYTTT